MTDPYRRGCQTARRRISATPYPHVLPVLRIPDHTPVGPRAVPATGTPPAGARHARRELSLPPIACRYQLDTGI